MKIICDTNIWYNIATDQIPLSKIKELHLVATNINFWELATTENLLDEPYLVVKAVKAMFEHSKEMYQYNPLDYLLQIANKNHTQKETSVVSFLLDALKKLMNLNERQVKAYIRNTPQFEEQILKFRTQRALIADIYNEKANETRKELKEQKIDSKKFRNLVEVNDMRESIKYLIEKFSSTRIEWKNFDWNRIELFTIMWFYYDREIKATKMNFEKNDTHDIFNFVYVDSNSKYWTLEKKKWARIFKIENATQKYIYEL